jgi:hypothetical protein
MIVQMPHTYKSRCERAQSANRIIRGKVLIQDETSSIPSMVNVES